MEADMVFFENHGMNGDDFFQVTQLTDFSFPVHFHRAYEMIYTNKGELYVCIDKKDYNLKKKDLIFITAFKEYALESYRVNAVDYLLKPVSYANFLSAAKKALTWHETAQAKETMLHAPKRRDDGIFVKSDYKIVHLFFGDILYVEGLKNYVKIFTQKHPKPIITLMPMKEIEDMLPKEAFIRVHRSFIVCKNKIESINKNRLWIGGREISIGQTYKDGFIKEILPRSV